MIISLLVNSEVSILQQNLMINPEQQEMTTLRIQNYAYFIFWHYQWYNESIKAHTNLYLNYLVQTNMIYVFHFEYIYLYQLHLSLIQYILSSLHIALPSNSTALYKPKYVTAHENINLISFKRDIKNVTKEKDKVLTLSFLRYNLR